MTDIRNETERASGIVQIWSGTEVVATGDTVEEAIWRLKDSCPGDFFYPDSGSPVRFIDVRSSRKGSDGLGEMPVERLVVVNTQEQQRVVVPPVDQPIARELGESLPLEGS